MFKIKLTFLFCFLVSEICCSWNPCPENEQSYLFKEQTGNWKDADSKCEIAGGALATVISENCIFRNLNENLTYFIGGKKSSSGTWIWIDDTQMNQTYWAPNEPNNSGGKENCLQIWFRNETYLWNDISCDRNISSGYICQKESDITESILSGISEQRTIVTTPKDTTIKRIEESDITESILSGISEQPTITTTPKDTTIKRIGTTTSYCDDLTHKEQHGDCAPTIEKIDKMVDSVLRGNRTKKKIELTIERALHKLRDISICKEPTPKDLDTSINLLDKIVNVSRRMNVSIPRTVIVAIIDNLLADNHTVAWQNTSTKQASARVNKIFRLVDKVGLHVLETINENETIKFNSTKNIVFTVAKIPAEKSIIFPENNSILTSSLMFPVQTQHFNQNIAYVAVKYKTLGNFINNNNRYKEHLGYNISSDIVSLTLRDLLFGETLDPSLHIKFLTHGNFHKSIRECVFWDFGLNSAYGGWSTRGCKLQSTADLYLHCECNHLTNFAVLVRPYSGIQEEDKALSWISIIGCSISVFLSLLTAIIYIVLWKSITCDLSRMVNKITVFLCLSIALAYTTFLIGGDKIHYKVGCTVITALLHYLFLFVFFLMLALGLYYFSSISLIKISFSKATTFQSKANFFGKIIWGIVTVLPAFITATTFGVVYSLNRDYHSKTSCWLSLESGALYGFVGPVACIVLINIVIVIILSVTLCSIGFTPQDKRRNRILAGIKSICTLLPVLGVTWLFGLLSINEDVVVFQYIFSLLNSFQGLFIFISKCLLSKKIKKSLIERIHKKDSELWNSRLSKFLSSNQLSMKTKKFSPSSKIQSEEEGSMKGVSKGNRIKGISFKSRDNANIAL